MRSIRHPETPDRLRYRLAALEATVRSLQAQLRGARAERDACLLTLRRLSSEADGDGWKD